MVKVVVNNQEYYLDGYIKSNLDMAKEVIKKDWDMIMVVDGYEGVGKSVIAQQFAFYCDPTFTLNRIAFTPKEFKEVVLNANKYQAVIYDEAYGGLSSRAAMSRVNRALVRMLAEIRQKNLFIFIVIPSFFDLDKYVAIWRSRALIHVYTGKGFERGRFGFYSMDMKKNLYVFGKKFYSYSKISPDFIGRFVNHYTVDEKEYRKRKILATKTEEEEMKDLNIIAKDMKKEWLQNIETANLSVKLTNLDKAKLIGNARRTIYRYLGELKQNL